MMHFIIGLNSLLLVIFSFLCVSTHAGVAERPPNPLCHDPLQRQEWFSTQFYSNCYAD